MNWPQITWIILMSLSLGINAEKHGKETKYNFWYCLISALLQFTLLYFGGFFE